MQRNFIALALVLLAGGCVSTSSVLEAGRDTFTVSSTADGFRDAASARMSAYAAGQEKCNSLGKRFQLLNESTGATRMGIDTTVNVTFRCLNASDPEYTRPEIRQAPDIVIEDQRSK